MSERIPGDGIAGTLGAGGGAVAVADGIRRLGDRALIVDLPDLGTVMAAREALATGRPAGVLDVVPAARTIAVLLDPARTSLDAARTWLARTLGAMHTEGATARATSAEPDVVIDVVYDGDDLSETAALAGMSADELVRRHASALWRVAFAGFAPGFGYLVTDDDWPEIPRRSSPRTRVPAGSVALAGGFSGVYPREGPGGWQLIGRTDAPLWRPRNARPALLAPDTVVRFRAVEALSAHNASAVADDDAGVADSDVAGVADVVSGRAAGRRFDDGPHAHAGSLMANREMTGAGEAGAGEAGAGEAGAGEAGAGERGAGADGRARRPALTVLRAGPQLLIEDLGRAGFSSIGAGRSGALDRGALRLANRLVGNVEDAAGLEAVVGAELRFEQPTWFAVTGARGALRLGGHPIEPDSAVRAGVGDVLSLGPAEHGLRFVVAVRGGVEVPLELGSASSDIGARLGPSPLADGEPIAFGDHVSAGIPAVDAFTVWSPSDGGVDVRVVAGPREEWFARASVEAFYDAEWEVTQSSNRIGMRLRSPGGIVLARSDAPTLPSELPSEPMVPGAIQVPPSGEPTVLLADGPVTGGYPVIAVVADADLDLFAQLRPGQRVRFRHAR